MLSSQTSGYSSNLEPALAEKVKRIRGEGNDFITNLMGKKDDNTPPIATRIKASKNPGTEEWSVIEMTYIPNRDDPSRILVTLHTIFNDACFFDALFYCSRFECVQGKMGQQPVQIESDPEGNVPDWRDVANQASQAVDSYGLVRPCADGRPLVDGTFPIDAVIIANTSPALPPAAEPALTHSQISRLLKKIKKQTGHKKALNIRTAVLEKSIQDSVYTKLLQLGDEIIETLRIIFANNCVSAYSNA